MTLTPGQMNPQVFYTKYISWADYIVYLVYTHFAQVYRLYLLASYISSLRRHS